MSKTEKIETIHGDVEYDVEQCASCGQEFKPDNMARVFTGTVRKVDNRSYVNYVRVKFNERDYQQLHFCEMCQDNPIKLRLPEFYDRFFIGALIVVGFLFGLLIGVGV